MSKGKYDKEWHRQHYQKPEVKQRHLEQGRRWRAANRDKQYRMDLKSRLKTQYGLTVGEYEELLKLQNYSCAICRSDTPKRKNARGFFIDHNHLNGRIRGLICHRCNLAIGWVEDNPNLIASLLDYLMIPRF